MSRDQFNPGDIVTLVSQRHIALNDRERFIVFEALKRVRADVTFHEYHCRSIRYGTSTVTPMTAVEIELVRAHG